MTFNIIGTFCHLAADHFLQSFEGIVLSMWECLRKFNDKYRFGLKLDLSGSGFISPKEGNNQDAVDMETLI